ncbi:N-acetylmuramoyl-L-alanine amidase [Paenimyroides ummariense]|uniref:N-acetylmuramoyl-L-alanine amidase n=1 Tax=Paenimyroides ummariense TaxID=913024 RepID=A0A1I5DZB7_9FLAO|nr:N-acetylmuramoyl-L-alanine amidase [Paenimyroides ummariense]SFO04497.1 N-acetylmuramoyl-L-alanine amidase [Paenimyroides ummariense]
MRTIKYIAVHCTATKQNATVEAIRNYWKRNLGWKQPGYHIIVKPNGDHERLALDETVCNGVKGYNRESIHVSYIGGIDDNGKALDNRTEAQKRTLLQIICGLKAKYPNAIIQGHRDFPNVAKDCPSFNAKEEYKHL